MAAKGGPYLPPGLAPATSTRPSFRVMMGQMPKMLATKALVVESRPPIFRYFKSSIMANSRMPGDELLDLLHNLGAGKAGVPHFHGLLHQKAQGECDVQGVRQKDVVRP